MLSPARFHLSFLFSFALWLGFAAGCSSDPRPERDRPLTVPDYPTAMTGTENFIDGKVVVEVTLGMPTDFRPGKGGGGKGPGGGGGGRHRGGGHRGGGMGGYDGEPPAGGDSEDGTPPPRVVGSTLPPAQLKLHLNNTSGEAISCEVVDFSSSLGNFAVFPATYQLEAGQSATSETMTSRLGVEGGTIPVTVGVRVKNGEVERKVVTLRLIAGREKAAEPTPPAK